MTPHPGGQHQGPRGKGQRGKSALGVTWDNGSVDPHKHTVKKDGSGKADGKGSVAVMLVMLRNTLRSKCRCEAACA